MSGQDARIEAAAKAMCPDRHWRFEDARAFWIGKAGLALAAADAAAAGDDRVIRPMRCNHLPGETVCDWCDFSGESREERRGRDLDDFDPFDEDDSERARHDFFYVGESREER